MNALVIRLINFYRKYLSPLKRVKCPYYPSCSEYGLLAFKKYSFPKAFLLTSWRLLRCNPFSKGGFDPLK